MSSTAILILITIVAIGAISGLSSTQEDVERCSGKRPPSSRPTLADITKLASVNSQLTASRHSNQAWSR